MTTPRRIVVISDLHMGSPERALFTAHKNLANFIDHLTADPGRVELAVLGDAVDFLQIEPFLEFTATTATRKAREIAKAHAEVFAALGRFVKVAEHKIRWFIGNHDIELLFDDVRRVFEAAIGCASGDNEPLTWHLDGAAFDYDLAAGGKVRLRHGNSADPWNEVDYADAKAVADRGGDANFKYPPGSRLVAQVINPLKAKGFKHIDLLKPEVTVALPLSLALWPEETRTYLRAAFPAFFDAQVQGAKTTLSTWMSANRKTFGARGPAKAAHATMTDEELLATALNDIAFSGLQPPETPGDAPSAEDVARAKGLASDLTKLLSDERNAKRATNARAATPTRATFGSGSFEKLVTSLLRDAAKRANDHSSPWAIDEPDDLYAVAKDTIEDTSANVAVLIVGHTHLARAMEFSGGYYFNTGTWADLMSIPRNLSERAFGTHASELLDYLRAPEKAPWSLRAFRRLTWVDVTLTDDAKTPWRASLCEWPAESPKVVHSAP